MDASHNLLVVAHQAVIRCLYSFLFRTPADKIPYEKIPLHTLMKITYDANTGKNTVEMQSFGIESVDTYRPKVKTNEPQVSSEQKTKRSPPKTLSPGKRSFHQTLEVSGSKMIA